MPVSLVGEVNEVYPLLIGELLEGAEVPSRNGPTRELHPCYLTLPNPRHRLVTSYERPVNVAFALAEVIWILAGRQDVEMLKFYNRRMDTWSDDGATFNAPYGHRMRQAHGFDQLGDVIRTLRADPFSRQATINIWHPQRDRGWVSQSPQVGWGESEEMVPHVTADRACNMLAHLMIRNDALDWLQIVRSNDAVWGLPYNIMQWTHVQEYVAQQVGVPVGSYYHVADSMHIYGANEPGVNYESSDTSRWEEAERIRPFDLYKETGTEHTHMGPLDAAGIQLLEAMEARIRTGNILSYAGVASAREQINAASLSNYWKNVLDILLAHKLYLSKEDRMAYGVLMNCPDRVYALAQMRFYFRMRWAKSHPDLVLDANQVHNPKLAFWLTN